MKIFVPIQLVPDLVEELVIAEDGKRLDPDSVRWIVSEFDDHAIEEAILLKEKAGGEVTVLAPDLDGADDVLYQSAAKGADRLVKLAIDPDARLNTHALARAIKDYLGSSGALPDLILTGVQTHNSLDGALGPLLAASVGISFVSCVAHTSLQGGKAIISKEYPGGLVAEMEVGLPAVLGIQAADTPPRYVPISKIRQAMKTSSIETEEVGELDLAGEVNLERLVLPDAGQRAQMLEGDVDQVADQLVGLFKELGVL